MTGRANLTKTRSGRPRVNVDPAAVAAELEMVKHEVSGLKRVLAPAFSAPPSPPMRESMSRGPGDYRPEPTVLRQASSNTDPWAGDVEHSPAFMEALARGVPIAELRQRSADDAISRAIAHEPSALVWESPVSCGRGGCRPATPCSDCAGKRQLVRDNAAHLEPPRQASIVHRPWESFPDHAPPPNRQPGADWAREQAAAQPPRQGGQVLKGPS